MCNLERNPTSLVEFPMDCVPLLTTSQLCPCHRRHHILRWLLAWCQSFGLQETSSSPLPSSVCRQARHERCDSGSEEEDVSVQLRPACPLVRTGGGDQTAIVCMDTSWSRRALGAGRACAAISSARCRRSSSDAADTSGTGSKVQKSMLEPEEPHLSSSPPPRCIDATSKSD
jgi:hypothetical protein